MDSSLYSCEDIDSFYSIDDFLVFLLYCKRGVIYVHPRRPELVIFNKHGLFGKGPIAVNNVSPDKAKNQLETLEGLRVNPNSIFDILWRAYVKLSNDQPQKGNATVYGPMDYEAESAFIYLIQCSRGEIYVNKRQPDTVVFNKNTFLGKRRYSNIVTSDKIRTQLITLNELGIRQNAAFDLLWKAYIG